MSESQRTIDTILSALKAQSSKPNPAQDKFLDALGKKFQDAQAEADAASKAGKLDEQQKANYAKIAGALPDLAKGLQSTIDGFQGGDPMSGAAGVMDICATVSSLLGSMAGAASAMGPLGALAGAIFSIVGMILRAFQPKQKGLGEILEGKLRLLASESIIVGVMTAIDEFESLYAKYPEQGPIRVKSKDLDSLAEGNAADHLFNANNWLLLDGNIKEATIATQWLDILSATIHAGCLQFRNLTLLLSIADPRDYDALDRTFKRIAAVHLGKMRKLSAPARDKGIVWHLGSFVNRHGGPLYRRRGANGSESWTALGGEQTAFAVARDAKDGSRHVVALEGDVMAQLLRPILEMLVQKPFPTHGRAYIKTTDGEWSATGTDWAQLPGLDGCRDIDLLPGDVAGEVYAYALQGNAVVARRITRTKDAVTVSENLEGKNGGLAEATETLLSIRVMPGYRPAGAAAAAAAVPYVLKERAGAHVIQRGLLADQVIHPLWDRVRGIAVDRQHLWIWSADAFACISHARARELSEAHADRETCKQAWIWYYTERAEALDRSENPFKDEYIAGLTAVAPAADGTVMVVFNSRIYTATPVTSGFSNSFMMQWQANDPIARATQVFKEPIDVWPLFEQRLKILEERAEDRAVYWDPRMR